MTRYSEDTIAALIALALLIILLFGCASLPEQCARRCADRSAGCAQAARKLFDTLRVLDYDVRLVYGRAGQHAHAWVEMREGGKIWILDPYAVFGWTIADRRFCGDFKEEISIMRN